MVHYLQQVISLNVNKTECLNPLGKGDLVRVHLPRAHNVLHASTSRCQWALCAQNKSSQGKHRFPHQLIISRCSRQVVLLNLNKGRAIRIARGGVELSKVAFTLWIWIFRFVDIQQYPLTNILHLNVLTRFDCSISKSGSIGGA